MLLVLVVLVVVVVGRRGSGGPDSHSGRRGRRGRPSLFGEFHCARMFKLFGDLHISSIIPCSMV